MQQLDLFGNFDPPSAPAVKEQPREEKPAVAKEPKQNYTPAANAEAKQEKDQPAASGIFVSMPVKAVADTEPAELPSPTPPVNEVIFSDDKIAVKIKPKTAEQLIPVEKNETVAAKVQTKSKRGRKSYKEIDAELDLIEVPDEEVLKQKLYYSITEVAKWFRVNASLLRYWENEFDILKPRKNRKGDRLFRPEDIRNLQLIYYLLRNRKFSLEGAKKYLRNHRQQADVNVQVTQSLTKFRSFLLDLKANLGA